MRKHIYDTVNKNNVIRSMAAALSTWHQAAENDRKDELWIPLWVYACSCIDALATLAYPTVQSARKRIVTYVSQNFPDLRSGIGAKKFYDKMRCRAIHSASVSKPFLLERGKATDPYLRQDSGYPNRDLFNLTRFLDDLQNHLQGLQSVTPVPPHWTGPTSFPTPPASGEV